MTNQQIEKILSDLHQADENARNTARLSISDHAAAYNEGRAAGLFFAICLIQAERKS